MMRRTVEVDGVLHTVMGHDPLREEYFVSASDNAESGAFYLCSIRVGRRACTCKRGRFGGGHAGASARPHCRHVEAALRASVLEAAARLGAMHRPVGPQGLPDPFDPADQERERSAP